MRVFSAFVVKEFLHILRDKQTMFILLAMPIVQLLLFGYALSTEVKHVRVAVVDHAGDALSRRLTQDIYHNPYFSPVDGVLDLSDAPELMRQAALDLVVVIPAKFQERVLTTRDARVQLLVDAANPNSGSIAAGYIEGIIAEMLMENTAQLPPYTIGVETRMLFNPALESTYNFVPGIIGLVMVIICSIMSSVSIVREKEKGTMEVLLASPLNSYTMLFAKTVPYLALSFVNLISILLISYFILHVPIHGSLFTLFTLSTLYIFLALALGLLVSTVTKDQASAIIIAGIGMMLPTLLLSGMLFPINSMPILLQWLAQAVPARWYVDGARRIMIQGSGWNAVWLHHVVLFGMTVVTAGLSMLKLKPRLG